MASSKSFFLLFSALLALGFILCSQASTLDATLDSNQFGNQKLGCSSPLTCCGHGRSGLCNQCCCCEGAPRDLKKLVLASINDKLGLDCNGIRCCRFSGSTGRCTACCPAGNSREVVAALYDNELQTAMDMYQSGNSEVTCGPSKICCSYNRRGYCTACCRYGGAPQDTKKLVFESITDKFEEFLAALEHNKLKTDKKSTPANEAEDVVLIGMVTK